MIAVAASVLFGWEGVGAQVAALVCAFVMAASLVYMPVLAALLFRPDLARRYFYLLFAACITLSVQMVGVYLVFASLILPAMAAGNLPGRSGLLKAYGVAGAAVTGGLILSILTDTPSGPVMVCSYALSAGITFLYGRFTRPYERHAEG